MCDRRTIKQIQAQEHLQPATTMYREMDMNFWLAQAEAALVIRRLWQLADRRRQG